MVLTELEFFFSRFVQVTMAFLQVCEHGNSINFKKYFDISAILYSTLPFKCTNIIQDLSLNLQYGARCAHMHAKKYFERKNTIGWNKASQLQIDQSPATHCLMFGFCFSVLPAWLSLFCAASNRCSFQQEIL